MVPSEGFFKFCQYSTVWCKKKLPLFEFPALAAAWQTDQPMHSQSASFGKFKFNSLNLAAFFFAPPCTCVTKERKAYSYTYGSKSESIEICIGYIVIRMAPSLPPCLPLSTSSCRGGHDRTPQVPLWPDEVREWERWWGSIANKLRRSDQIRETMTTDAYRHQDKRPKGKRCNGRQSFFIGKKRGKI